MKIRSTRTAVVVTLAGVLALGTAAPVAAVEPGDEFIGYVQLATTDPSIPGLVLQETNEVYPAHSSARNTVVSPNWSLPHAQWAVYKVGDFRYRLVNVATGHALQRTHEHEGWGAAVVSSPDEWRSTFQEWDIRRVDVFSVRLFMPYTLGSPAQQALVVHPWRPYLGNTEVFTISAGPTGLEDSAYTWTLSGVSPMVFPDISDRPYNWPF